MQPVRSVLWLSRGEEIPVDVASEAPTLDFVWERSLEGVLALAPESFDALVVDATSTAEALATLRGLRAARRLPPLLVRLTEPDPDSLARRTGAAPPPELLEVIEIVLLSVSELTDYLSSSALGRAVDAIEILERLLLEAGVTPWAYVRALPYATTESRRALAMLRQTRVVH